MTRRRDVRLARLTRSFLLPSFFIYLFTVISTRSLFRPPPAPLPTQHPLLWDFVEAKKLPRSLFRLGENDAKPDLKMVFGLQSSVFAYFTAEDWAQGGGSGK